jgi:hypothetical protein
MVNFMAPDDLANDANSQDSHASTDELWSRLDQQAHDCLGISGASFLEKWLNGRIRMTLLEDSDYVPWLQRPRPEPSSTIDDPDELLPPYVELSNDEWRDMFDRLVRRELGIGGEEFVRKFNAGEYPDWDPELASLVFFIPTLDY